MTVKLNVLLNIRTIRINIDYNETPLLLGMLAHVSGQFSVNNWADMPSANLKMVQHFWLWEGRISVTFL